MSAGFQVTKDSLNQRSGSVVVTLEAALDDVARLKAWLDARTDQEIIDLGFDQAGVTLLKSSMTDLDNLRLTAYGERAQDPANNFLYFASQLRGIL